MVIDVTTHASGENLTLGTRFGERLATQTGPSHRSSASGKPLTSPRVGSRALPCGAANSSTSPSRRRAIAPSGIRASCTLTGAGSNSSVRRAPPNPNPSAPRRVAPMNRPPDAIATVGQLDRPRDVGFNRANLGRGRSGLSGNREQIRRSDECSQTGAQELSSSVAEERDCRPNELTIDER